MGAAASVEFSRPVSLARAGAASQAREIVATPEERARLARRLGLVSLDRLSARLAWRRQSTGVIRLEGELEAAVTQSCVVTLEPVAAEVTEGFVRHFVRAAPAAEPEVVVDPEADDPPEPLGDGLVDLGEIVVQQLALARDPYPRAAGSTLPAALAGEPAVAEPADAEGPFRVLAGLKTEQ